MDRPLDRQGRKVNLKRFFEGIIETIIYFKL